MILNINLQKLPSQYEEVSVMNFGSEEHLELVHLFFVAPSEISSVITTDKMDLQGVLVCVSLDIPKPKRNASMIISRDFKLK